MSVLAFLRDSDFPIPQIVTFQAHRFSSAGGELGYPSSQIGSITKTPPQLDTCVYRT